MCHHCTDSEISFGLEPTPTDEQIWSEADAVLMNVDDGMGPLNNGGFDDRYLHSFSSPLTHVKLTTVLSSSCPWNVSSEYLLLVYLNMYYSPVINRNVTVTKLRTLNK